MTLMDEVNFLLDSICNLSFVDHVEYNFTSSIESNSYCKVAIVFIPGIFGRKNYVRSYINSIYISLRRLLEEINTELEFIYIFPEVFGPKDYIVRYENEEGCIKVQDIHSITIGAHTVITREYCSDMLGKRYKCLEEYLLPIKRHFTVKSLSDYGNYLLKLLAGRLVSVIFNFDVVELKLNRFYFPVYFIFKEDTYDGLIENLITEVFNYLTDICEIHCLKGWHDIQLVDGAVILEEVIDSDSSLEKLIQYRN